MILGSVHEEGERERETGDGKLEVDEISKTNKDC